MSTEQPEFGVLFSADKIVLASRVNKLCAIDADDDFDTTVLLEDAQAIVNTFDSKLKVSSDIYIKSIIGGKPRSFGGLASTGGGQFQVNLENGGRNKGVQLGQVYEDRIGLYKITKTNEGNNFALNLQYFMTQISTDGNLVGIGPSTHILYDKKDCSIRGVAKSKPMLLKFLSMKIIWFKQSNLWGKAKLDSLTLRILY